MQAIASLSGVLSTHGIKRTKDELVIGVEYHTTARWIQIQYATDLVRLSRKEGKRVRITWSGAGEGEGYPFYPWMQISEQEEHMDERSLEQNADYLKVLEFMRRQYEEGKIVILTSHIMGADPSGDEDICRCIHTNDKLLPSRSSLKPYEFNGYDYLKSWRCLPDGGTSLAPSVEYQRLRSLLDKDGFVPGYEYTLMRPDGAFCRYLTDYYLVDDYCGQPVRIGVSRPEDWSLIES